MYNGNFDLEQGGDILDFRKHWRIALLGMLVSAVALLGLGREVNLERVVAALRAAQWVYLFPAGLLLIAALLPRARRWQALLGGALPLGRAFSIMNVAYLVNGVLPLRIGEVARVFLAARVDPPVPVFKTTSTIVIERLLDLLAVLVMLGIALATSPLPDEYRTTASFALVTLVVGFAVLLMLVRQRALAQRLLVIMLRHIPALRRLNMMEWLNHFLDGLRPLTDLRLLAQALFWTGLGWGLSACAGYIVMLVFYDQADWATTCLYIAAAAFAIAVPAVPGNMGTYEFSIVLALQAIGFPTPYNTAVSFAFVVHWINLLVHVLTGIAGLLREGISLGQLSRGVQDMNQKTKNVITGDQLNYAGERD